MMARLGVFFHNTIVLPGYPLFVPSLCFLSTVLQPYQNLLSQWIETHTDLLHLIGLPCVPLPHHPCVPRPRPQYVPSVPQCHQPIRISKRISIDLQSTLRCPITPITPLKPIARLHRPCTSHHLVTRSGVARPMPHTQTRSLSLPRLRLIKGLPRILTWQARPRGD